MAIPLGAPRQLTGVPPPSAVNVVQDLPGYVTPKASTHLVTSTPVEQAPYSERTGSVKFKEHPVEPKPQLTREVIPCNILYALSYFFTALGNQFLVDV